MSADRLFLGWDGHALRRVAAHLMQMGANPIVVTPTARSGRRLLELLVQQAGGALDAVPDIVTAGRLPEMLYDPPRPIAGDWTAMLARAYALRSLDAEVLTRITPNPPQPDDLGAWWSLAKRLAGVVEDIAAGSMTVGGVVDTIRHMKLDDRALGRLEALAALERAYHQTLASAGYIDRQQARLDAIAAGACFSDRPIVLACVADLSTPLVRMLEQLDAPVTALIHAPPEVGAGFGAFGQFIPAYWQKQTLPIAADQLHFVDRPADQARQVVAQLAAWSPSPDDATVGLGDPNLAPTVARAIEHAGANARYAGGRPVVKSRPGVLLRALGRFAGSRRFDDFAALLRHPDAVAYAGQPAATEDWLTLLDRYANDHLQGALVGRWLGDADQQAQLKALWDRVGALVPDDNPCPLPQWAGVIADALGAVYRSDLSRQSRDDHDLIVALQTIGSALRELAELPLDAPTTPRTDFAQAISLLLQQVADAEVPEPGGEAAIELMGLLELPLDDANHLVLTGVNEGHLPGARVADPWLPDSMRRALGLPDTTHRFGRDLYLLAAILRSRRVALIAGRTTAEGDPLAPSRLLLACDDQQLAARIGAFYAHAGEERRQPPPLLLTPGKDDRFLIPPPTLDAPALAELPVTAFRDYIACPYRFYLRHVLKLKGLDDRAVELDAMAFGTLAHDVMKAFADAEARDSDNAETIADFFDDRLNALAAARYGREPRMALRLQVEQLRARLHAFAPVQAQMRQQGWRITNLTEKKLRAELDVAGQPFAITGRVDRVDLHPEKGYRILDYKTGDRGSKPESTHRRGRDGSRTDKQWVDLQLPLYRDLCAPLGVRGDIELGYVNLPRRLEDTGLALAEWDAAALAEAMALRDAVIEGVLSRVFWPPREPPGWADEFVGLCADFAFDRTALIRASTGGAP